LNDTRSDKRQAGKKASNQRRQSLTQMGSFDDMVVLEFPMVTFLSSNSHDETGIATREGPLI
jgi:hypothetical protein